MGSGDITMVRDLARLAILRARATACAVFLAIVAGCNHSSQESQVSGRVKLDGTPVGPGTVVFAPVSSGKPATGSVDASGNYSMNTSRDVGLASGKYKVAVSIRERAPDIKRGERPQPGKLLIPEKYEDSSKSGLEFDVAPGSNTINIELKSQLKTTVISRVRSRLCDSGFYLALSDNLV
jgi:hypothetical protein